MLTVDIALPDVEELQKLVASGQEKGFLTYDEIVKGIEEVELTKEQVEDFTTYLIDHGVRSSRIISRGYGESRPVASNDTPDGRQLNRRVEIHVKANPEAPAE